MTRKIMIDRSRYETGLRCKRQRWYEYHEGGMGIVPARKSLPLCVGGSVHVGLERLLRVGQELIDNPAPVDISMGGGWNALEDSAVAAALADFATHRNAIEIPDAEAALLAAAGASFEPMRNDFDEYLFQEQSALVEGEVRAYSRRRLRPLLRQFEVLEVEQEGKWLLSGYRRNENNLHTGEEFEAAEDIELWFMSRPDALLRDRESNQLYLQSFKTTASWDVRKARDAEHDMQGLSEGVEVERRLADWWQIVRAASGDSVYSGNAEAALDEISDAQAFCDKNVSLQMRQYLRSVDSPPRILAVRYEFLLKGDRWKDRDLSERFGVEMRSQKSHLIRQYAAVSTPQRGTAGYSIGDVCWAWDYTREDGRDGSLAWQNWKSRPVWDQPGGVKGWIDNLEESAEVMSGEDSTMGLEPRSLGFGGAAQAVGTTKQHPLDAVLLPPIVIYRNLDELRDLVDQMEAVERGIAEGVEAVNATGADEGERRHALNVHFPMTRRACEYPTTCSYTKICWGGEDIRANPLGSGLYKIREANHPQENQP